MLSALKTDNGDPNERFVKIDFGVVPVGSVHQRSIDITNTLKVSRPKFGFFWNTTPVLIIFLKRSQTTQEYVVILNCTRCLFLFSVFCLTVS